MGLSARIGEGALLARFGASLVRIAVDRIEEAFGGALPRTPEQLARPKVLERLLRDFSADPSRPLAPVRSVSLPGIHFESSNCNNFLIDVERDGAPAERLYAKLASTDLATTAFANAVGFWDQELHFCAHVASEVGVRVPEVHAIARHGARFVLLLENLQALPGAQLFTNRDMAAGSTPERARRCVEAFAELHAPFWGAPSQTREALVPATLHPFLAPGRREQLRALSARAVGPAHDAAPEIFRAEHVELYRLAVEKWDALLEATFAEPLTLVHGDSHLANCFEYTEGGQPRIGLLDFQGVHWGKGIRDVQYHLTLSLEPEVLAACESELVDAYFDALGERGVRVDRAAAREHYRAVAFQTLSAAVVPLGLGSLSERSETLLTVLRRSVAAADRLRLGDWLADL